MSGALPASNIPAGPDLPLEDVATNEPGCYQDSGFGVIHDRALPTSPNKIMVTLFIFIHL